MKKVRVIKILISAIVITLSLLGLFNIINIKIIIPIALLLLGILSILNGYDSYINNKKGESILLILSGVFVIFVSVIITFF
ncbi:hypothetical protein KPL35_14645 [Clostridium sp. CF011]|uniref:hypothetical protein n=1 Tax=unclassified Clostridium TaxID=2614128 RepID=UPI001C0BE48F|nr:MULTISPECIES: hypothetical protein [unclassified Clostridium]MBU3093307.1 hypothetical protein [Clostridium sp. CF011]MBW9146717.1 hypothetical protein [Clostridium sp. CM027]UVE41624.1 hypothetical protein KTC92_03850 [Clostridium sp. CM027]WAG70617.1 hypothetical protein LL036_04020 [Clostridium sp. CF011]